MISTISLLKQYYKSITLTLLVLGGVALILSCGDPNDDNTSGKGGDTPKEAEPETVRSLDDIFNDFKKDKEALDISDQDLNDATTDDDKAKLILEKALLLNTKSLVGSGVSFKVSNEPFKSKDSFGEISEFKKGEAGTNGGDKIEYKADDHKDLVDNLQKAISVVVNRRKDIAKMLHTHAEAQKTTYSDGTQDVDFNSPKTFCKQKYDKFLAAVQEALKDVFKAAFDKKFTETGKEFEPLSVGIVLYLKVSAEDIVKGAKNENDIIEILENTQKISDNYRKTGSTLATLKPDDLETLIGKLSDASTFKENLFLEMVSRSDALPLFYFSNPLTNSEKKLGGKEVLNADNTDANKYSISDDSWKNNPIKLIFQYINTGYDATAANNIGKITPAKFEAFATEHVELMAAVHEAITNGTKGPKITSAAVGIGALYLIEQKKTLLQGTEITAIAAPNVATTLKVYTSKMSTKSNLKDSNANNTDVKILKNCTYTISTGILKTPANSGGGVGQKLEENLKNTGIAKP
jgi:hypothetical protein